MIHNEIISTSVNKIDKLKEKYNEYEGFIPDSFFHEINQFTSEFKKDTSAILEENRKLRVGIVGQIKAGKSSFLNALLFNGMDLLPKAATPMTAALTVISYSPTPYAEIEFYSIDEWQLIERKAQEYRHMKPAKQEGVSLPNLKAPWKDKVKPVSVMIPKDLESADELVRMVEKKGLDIYKHLGKTIKISDIKSTNELIGKLQNYVGAAGRYTPIVKSSNLHIPDESLKTMDVIDTPGVNDPIISRGQRTREYLGKCDVVFLLSYAGQFMDKTDVELLTQNIPDKGIKNVVVLGSKFDSALLDEGDKYPSIIQALRGVTEKLNKQAENTVLPIVRRHRENQLLQSLKDSLPPIFISSFAYNMGKRLSHLTKEETHVFKGLQNTFPNDELTAELLIDLSNINRLKEEELTKVKKHKEMILKERFNNLLFAQENAFVKKLEHYVNEFSIDLEKISHTSEEDIEQSFNKIQNHIKGTAKKVDVVFDNQLVEMQTKFSYLKTEFKKIARDYKKFEPASERRKVKVGTERYGFLWLKKRDVFENQTFTFANVHQVIDKIESLVIDLEEQMKLDFERTINLKSLKNNLKSAIIGVYDLSDETFNFEDLITPVQKILNKISVPDFELDAETYKNDITSQFGFGRIEGYSMDQLKQEQYKQIDLILDETASMLRQKITEVEMLFENISKEFIKDVLHESNGKLEEIKGYLIDREHSKRQYGEIINLLKQDIKELKSKEELALPVEYKFL